MDVALAISRRCLWIIREYLQSPSKSWKISNWCQKKESKLAHVFELESLRSQHPKSFLFFTIKVHCIIKLVFPSLFFRKTSREKSKKLKSQEADKFLNLKIHPLHDSDPPPGFRGVWGYQEYQVSLQMCSLQEQAALHEEIPYHHISISYYSPTLPYIALILKGKECKASSERAQGQRAAHKGRGSHLSSVVPLHICCRLPQRVTIV